ncbi:hypothetical protein chiPu_0020320 [Chiloscyllium punctatum]|uniref:RING-type domain-containing protein n=1 Tax=Chiloscyllium punctatum TaxID=137246 RepID=A0A401REC3_CHIPU|nr:hypothetical protein [Chiloscyllium punctatum]
MQTEDLKDELTCALCLQVYQDPVRLPCLHSFCLKCIEEAWAQTPGAGKFECPQCRQIFNRRPSLERKATGVHYRRSESPTDSPHLMCEYCIENPTPAVKTCLKCETSFCSQHVKPHLLKEYYKDHTLIEPVRNFKERQCFDHKKVLEFYCNDDAECVCGSCIVTGKHKSHTLLSLDQAQSAIKVKLEKEFEKIDDIQRNCSSKKEELERSEAEIKTQINQIKEKLSKNFSEWRRKLDEDEESTMRVIDEEGLQALSQIRSCSEALNSKMEQIALIDREIQSFLQKDPLSIIQVHLQYIWPLLGKGNFL